MDDDMTTELASSFELLDRTKALPSPVTLYLYRVGRVLFSCHADVVGSGSNDRISISVTNMIGAFERMMSTLSEDYVHVCLLRKLHHAYASAILSFTAAAPATPATSALRAMMVKPSTVSTSWEDVVDGTESLCGIYLASTACRCCCVSLSSEKRRRELELVFVSLSWMYDNLSNRKSAGDVFLQQSILKTLSRLLVEAAQRSSNNENDMDEHLSNIMTLIQNIQAATGEHNCALGDMLDMSEDEVEEQSIAAAMLSEFQTEGRTRPPQLEYFLAMLRASPKSKGDLASSSPASTANTASTSLKETTPQLEPQRSMTDIQIDQVQRILPNLGEGYIEEALKCYNSVERTVEALLQITEGGNNDSIHPRLLLVPTNLPRKLRDRVDRYSANINLHRGATAKEDGAEHAKIQKEHIKHVERQAEEEAFLIDHVVGLRNEDGAVSSDQYGLKNNRNEYDDDYDDQYDGVGGVGGMGGLGDDGLYDVDLHNIHQKHDRMASSNEQEMWKKYNSLMKDVDAENKYWESNKNSNRGSSGQRENSASVGWGNQQEEGQDVKYRGPDKGKKGRLIGPDGKYLPIKRGGKKGRGGDGAGDGRGDVTGNGNAGRGAGRGGKGGRGGSGRGGRGGAGPKKDTKKEGNKAGGDELSKIQKRRKNDNKAKVANHHRKERATKKASGGMVI